MANWKYVKIGDVCTVERGGSPRPIDKFITDDPSGINWIKIGDTSDSMYITQTAQKIIPEGMKKSRYVQPGDFLLSNSMSFGRPYILKIDGCIHDGWLVLRDNDGIFDKRFLYYYLSSPSTYQKFKNMAVGGVVNNLNSEMVRGVTVPVPTIEEQLDIVSTLVTLRKEQLAKLDQLVKSRFIELFGNFVYDRDRWPTCEVGDVADTIDPQPSHRTPPISSDGIPYIGIAECNYKTRLIDFEKARKVGQNVLQEHLERYTLDEGDFIIGKIGTIGKPFFVPAEQTYTLSANTVLIKPIKGKVVPLFLFAVFQSEYMDRIIDAEKKSTSQPAFGIQKVRKIEIPLPPMELQEQFAAFVEQIDKSKLAIQQSLEKLELLKKSLMQEYFR